MLQAPGPLSPYRQAGSDGEAAASAKQERDELLMRRLTEEVLPQAYTLYVSGPLHVRRACWGRLAALRRA
jgi:hypothetical protein